MKLVLDFLVGMLSDAGLGLSPMDDLRGLTGVVFSLAVGSSDEGGLLQSVVSLSSLLVCGVDDMTFLLGVAGDASILSSPLFSTDVDLTDLWETTVPSSNVLARL